MRSHSRTLTSSSGRLKQCEHVQMNTRQFSVSQPLSDRSGQINSQDVSGEQLLLSQHLISTSSINTWSLTLKGSFQFQPVMDVLVAEGGGTMSPDQEAPRGPLSMGHFLKHLPPGYPSSLTRQLLLGLMDWPRGPGQEAAAPFEVFISVFCHYMIKAIAARLRRFDKDSIQRR